MKKEVDSKVIARAMILKLRKCAASADQRSREKMVTRLVRALTETEK